MRGIAEAAAPGLGATSGATRTDDHELSRTDLNSRDPEEQHGERIWTTTDVVWDLRIRRLGVRGISAAHLVKGPPGSSRRAFRVTVRQRRVAA